jgi:hypothetical protein
MGLLFHEISVGDLLELPGRASQPDRYEVVKKYNNRVVVESLLRKGGLRHMMDNQFNQAGFEPVSSFAVPVEPEADTGWALAAEDDREAALRERQYGQ